MKRFFFPVLVVLLLAVAGLGAAGRFGHGPLAPFLHKEIAETPTPQPQAPHRVLSIGEVVIPIVRNHVIERQIGMDIDIDVNGEYLDHFNLLLPRIENNVRLDLIDFLPSHSNVHSAADRQAVHDRVLKVMTEVVGPGVIRDVVIRTFYNR